jgi:uncharacterized protein (TIGR03435 family)
MTVEGNTTRSPTLSTLRLVTTCLLLATASATAQKTPQFEVASIRPTPDDSAGATIGLRVTGKLVHYGGLTLKDYIGMAYSLDGQQVIAPDWTNEQRFEISATLAAGATREQIPDMLQALLVERFQLKVHKESREFPVYALVVSKGGLKIKGKPVDPNAPPPAATETEGGATNSGVVINMRGGTFTIADNKFAIKNLTMEDLALAVTRFADRKTIDATGLTDRFDLTLELTAEDFSFVMMQGLVNNGYARGPQALRVLDGAPSNVLGRYITKTGLALEERRAPLEVVVVDSVSRAPTEN